MRDAPMNLQRPELIYDCRHELAEGPVWHQGYLWWVNIMAGELHRLESSGGAHESRRLGGHLGCAVPAADGRWVLAHKRGLAFFDWNTGQLEQIAEPEASLRGNRFNDGKCDPAGRLWAGTMSCALKANAGSLYRLDASLNIQRMLDGVTVSNGLAWSADGRTMYYTETLTHRVDALNFDPRIGAISGRRTLADIPAEAGAPDGMAIDVNDNLWVALWGGSSLVCFNGRTGVALARVELPVSQPSSAPLADRTSTSFSSPAHGRA
jgi:sugar lactone lactonase YvrE